MSPKTNIKIGHLKITDHLVLGVTLDKIKNGQEQFELVELEAKPYGGWNPLADDLRNGKLDAAFILAPLAMELFYAGVKIKLVLQGHKSGSILVKNKRANIKEARDFKGKKVLIPHYLSAHHLLFDKLLRDNGVEIEPGKGVTFEVVMPVDIPEYMEWDEKGTIGGFIVAEPFGTQVVKAGYGEEFALSKDIWPKHPCCVLVIKEELINNAPDAVQELVTSLVKSGDFIADNPDAAAEIGARFLNQDVEVVKHVLTQPPDRVCMGEMKPVIADLEFMQTYLTETVSAMSQKIDLNAFVDMRFSEKAGAK
jgi:NitT/TauT family transport system substrate-binding protein